jgi:hypothetical protein
MLTELCNRARFSIPSLSVKFTDRDRSIEVVSLIKHDTTNWIKPHHKLASSSSITEWDLWAWLTDRDQYDQWPWPVSEAKGGEKKEKLTRRPGAYLAGMARQCLRGRPGAAEGRLHRGAPGAPHLALPLVKAREAQAHEHAQQLSKLQRWGTSSEG